MAGSVLEREEFQVRLARALPRLTVEESLDLGHTLMRIKQKLTLLRATEAKRDLTEKETLQRSETALRFSLLAERFDARAGIDEGRFCITIPTKSGEEVVLFIP